LRGAQVAGVFVEQTLEFVLRQPLHRQVAQRREVDVQVAER
jgi:hypothetical protein